jgi:hypothetical protein
MKTTRLERPQKRFTARCRPDVVPASERDPAPDIPWNRDAFVMPFTGADAAQIAQLGVFFTIGAAGQADAALVSLGGVGPDAAATFTRVGG